MWLNYNSFIDANPDGVNYQLFVPFNVTHEVMIENGAYLFTKKSTLTDGNELDKRHKNCLNRNESLKCQACGGKFLGYSSAHNCNGKAVSCCTPQGPSGTMCML